MKNTLLLLAVMASILGASPLPPPLASSDFDDGTLQGWRTDPPFNGVLRVSAVGQGHPGRAMEALDNCSGCGGLWVRAPQQFEGDLSRYAGLSWDEYVPNYGADTVVRPRVSIRSPAGTTYTTTNMPIEGLGAWTPRFASFVSNAWVRAAGTESFAEVLTNVVALVMRVDTSTRASGALESRVDNILLVPLQTLMTVRVSQVEVCWNSQAGRPYQVQYRSDVNGNLWTDLGTLQLGNGSTNCILDAVALNEPRRFYRVITQGQLAQSTFDSNSDGWRMVDRAFGTLTEIGTRSPAFRSAGGNPGGFIQATDGTGTANGDWWWRAPVKFLGNQSAAYGGRLQFDLISDLEATPVSVGFPIILIGGGVTNVSARLPTPPLNVWTDYSVSLREGTWTNAASGLPSSAAELRAALSSLISLDIPGEFGTGFDTGGLDNVTLWPGGPASSIRVAEVEVCWNSQASRPYQVQYRSDATGNPWTDLGAIELGNGFTNCILDAVAPNAPRRIYRVITRP